MGKRDTKAAKAKRAERRGKGSLKTDEKTEKSNEKKARKQANQKDDDDLQAILDEFKASQASQTTVKEEAVPPPKRSAKPKAGKAKATKGKKGSRA